MIAIKFDYSWVMFLFLNRKTMWPESKYCFVEILVSGTVYNIHICASGVWITNLPPRNLTFSKICLKKICFNTKPFLHARACVCVCVCVRACASNVFTFITRYEQIFLYINFPKSTDRTFVTLPFRFGTLFSDVNFSI